MIRLMLLSLCLAACSGAPLAVSPAAEVRPIIASDDLQGRWAIASVNGQPAKGLWLEFGREGRAAITEANGALFVASPQPPTSAFLGCNNWYPSGWTRNGDKLVLGVAMSHQTERGCDVATMTLDDSAYAILTKAMTMELTPPDRLRLINESGTIDLVRS